MVREARASKMVNVSFMMFGADIFVEERNTTSVDTVELSVYPFQQSFYIQSGHSLITNRYWLEIPSHERFLPPAFVS